MNRAAQTGRDPVPGDLRVVVVDRDRLHDARRLDLLLPRAVLVEVPVEAVVVVAHGGDGGDDQPARAAHPGLDALLVGVGVLPKHAEVLFVDADGVLDGARAAVLVGDVAVHVDDFAEAVAAQLERVGQPAQTADLAAVEGVLEGLGD